MLILNCADLQSILVHIHRQKFGEKRRVWGGEGVEGTEVVNV